MLALMGMVSLLGATTSPRPPAAAEILRLPNPAAVSAASAREWLLALRREGPARATAPPLQPPSTLSLHVPPLPREGAQPLGRSGDGVVVAVSGRDPAMLAAAYALLCVLRDDLHSRTAVEFFHLGEDEAFSPAARQLFEAKGDVAIRDLRAVAEERRRSWQQAGQGTVLDNDHDAPHATAAAALGVDGGGGGDGSGGLPTQRGWHIKPLAVLCASFERVLLLDADAVPFQAPEAFFGLLGHSGRGGGLTLFRDHVPCLTSVNLWLLRQLGLTEPQSASFCVLSGGQEIDSSAVVVDTRVPAAWRALHVIEHLNRRWPRAIFENDHYLAGDKDTWLIGALLSGLRADEEAQEEEEQQQEEEEGAAVAGAAHLVSPVPPGYLLWPSDYHLQRCQAR
eukprot:COSAG01_NODE_9162_length_2532_cov_2.386354_3_plen_395_part_00